MKNLVEILINAPKGLELYSPLFGKVYLDQVTKDKIFINDGYFHTTFYSNGKYYDFEEAECMLFPDYYKSWKNWKKSLLYKKGNILKDLKGNLYIFDFYSDNSLYVFNSKGERKVLASNTNLTWASKSERNEILDYFQNIKEKFDLINKELKRITELYKNFNEIYACLYTNR